MYSIVVYRSDGTRHREISGIKTIPKVLGYIRSAIQFVDPGFQIQIVDRQLELKEVKK